ncbi:uncharacterized protein LOC117168179 [Belonocnema kinseyi]|uniref:uncharacterized protein LOC117168179 n=1 Tax=Belonocnema kinseyi TaxID=2817044 RepID=UPI00143CC6D5|nr:uncharacterized protein LOC117168179 [Belonocnema kinseyi]XP_033209524.1 uncharacterized protein LOC117168179 [Belonocnema kinseyi]
MNIRCWGNPRLEEKKEKEAWPKLTSENHQRRKNDSQTPARWHQKKRASNSLGGNQSQIDDQLRIASRACDYPELGGQMSRKIDYSGQGPSAIINENVVTFDDESGSRTKSKKHLRRSKRSNLIRINIQQVLENQIRLKNTLAEKKIRCCDRVVEAKRNKIFLSKIKRPSKLKQVIINEREKQREMRNREKRVQPVIDDLPKIDLGKLKIIADPELDFDHARNLATLNIFGNEHRDLRNDPLSDEILESRKDVTEKLENLLISTNDNDVNVVEDDLRYDIANMKIDGLDSLGGGIHLGDINRTLNLRSEDNQILQNPNLNFQGKENELKYTRKFREYCTNIVSVPLNEKLETFLNELFRLQKKLYERDNVKGRYRRRYYTGFKEVEKHVNLKKVRFVIIVPDLERIQVEGGLDDAVDKLISSCRKQDITICFGLSRRKLGYLTHRKGCVSCIGISHFSGTEEKLEEVLNNLVDAKNEFMKLKDELNKVIDTKKIIDEDTLLSARINLLLKILASTT